MSVPSAKTVSAWMLAAIVLGVGVTNAAEPRFKLASEDGKSWVAPGAFNDRPAVFMFWDTQCAPCLQELRKAAALRTGFPEATLVAVSLSSRADTRRVLATLNLPTDIILARAPDNPQGLLTKLGNRHGALPFSAVFLGNGELCAYGLGTLNESVLSRAAAQCRRRP